MTLADLRVGLRAYLLDDSGINAVIAGRVYPVKLPQGQVNPSLVYSRISAQGDHHQQGPSGRARSRVQIDAWAQGLDTASNLADLVKERIDGFRGTMLWGEDSPAEGIIVQGIFFDGEGEEWDDVAKLYRVRRDYIVNYSER